MFFHLFGCQDQLENALDPSSDELGFVADSIHLPKRVRSARRARPKGDNPEKGDEKQDVVAF